MPHQTGPKTPEGKQTSSQNNRRHGLATANIIVPPGDRPYFDQIEAELRDEIRPDGPLEDIAFRRLITANWQMEQCQQHEATLAVLEPSEQNKANLEKVRRYYLRWEGSYNSAFRQIRLLQTDRACQGYMNGDAPDFFAPLADLPKIERYARRIASSDSFEAKVGRLLMNQAVVQGGRSPRTAPDAPVRPSDSILCETKSPANTPSVGRNSPCPCGSGKKYKRCCGTNAPPILNRAA